MKTVICDSDLSTSGEIENRKKMHYRAKNSRLSISLNVRNLLLRANKSHRKSAVNLFCSFK